MLFPVPKQTQPADVLLPLFEQKGWQVDHTLIKSNANPFPYDTTFDWVRNISLLEWRRQVEQFENFKLQHCLQSVNEDYRIIFLNSYSDYGIRVMCEVSVTCLVIVMCEVCVKRLGSVMCEAIVTWLVIVLWEVSVTCTVRVMQEDSTIVFSCRM